MAEGFREHVRDGSSGGGGGSGGSGGVAGNQSEGRNGPRVRTDIVDVYVFRRATRVLPDDHGIETIQFLQMLRKGGANEALGNTWQPVMGHVEAGETAAQTACRELAEETGLTPSTKEFVGLWALEQVHPFYLASQDCIVMSPRFAAEVGRGWVPTMSDEHTDHRWVWPEDVPHMFMWPGQWSACVEVETIIADPNALARDRLRLR